MTMEANLQEPVSGDLLPACAALTRGASQASEETGGLFRHFCRFLREVTLFAYPYGMAGPREFEAASRAGFEAAVTGQMGNVVGSQRPPLGSTSSLGGERALLGVGTGRSDERL
jgi:hypothetical protein